MTGLNTSTGGYFKVFAPVTYAAVFFVCFHGFGLLLIILYKSFQFLPRRPLLAGPVVFAVPDRFSVRLDAVVRLDRPDPDRPAFQRTTGGG